MTMQSTTGKVIDPNGVAVAKHYNVHPSGVEAIELIRYMSGCMFNAFKYVWRAGEKDSRDTQKDLDKALWYLRDEMKHTPFFGVDNKRLHDLREKMVAVAKADNPNRGEALLAIFNAAVYQTEYRFEVAIAAVSDLKLQLREAA